MANVISTFDLERLAKAYDIRIWLCRRMGRRWSFVEGAGAERVLPSELVFENADSGVFVQGEDYDRSRLTAEIAALMAPQAVC